MKLLCGKAHAGTAKQKDINDAYLSLLVTTQLEVLASLDGQHSLGSAIRLHTLEPQHNFLCSLSLKRQSTSFGLVSHRHTHDTWHDQTAPES